MNRDNFVKHRKHAKRLGLNLSLKQGTGGCNPCFRPSAESSKADLVEYHGEEMALRRAHQRKRTANSARVRSTSIATGNRHGGPHQHQREIERRVSRSA